MAKITTSEGATNDPQGRYDAIHYEGGGELRPGISSSTSGSTPDRSGTSGTTDHPSPVPTTDSPSSPAPPAEPTSSSAPSTDGSGQETGSSQPSRWDSSEDSAAPREATPAQVRAADLDEPEPEPAVEPYAGLSGKEALALAQEEYEKGNLDESERLLGVAENRGEDAAVVVRARTYIARARERAGAASSPPPGASGAGPSEEDPTAGGALVP